MGVVRELIQIVAVRALRGNTIAGDDVHDSMITALPDAMLGKQRPVMQVSIEDSASPGPGDGLFRTDVSATLSIQMAVATTVTVELPDGGGTVQELAIGDTDAALEATLNLMDRQLRLALSNPTNPWAEAFRKLVVGFGKITDVRLGDPETGRRHAARVMEIEIMPIAEPSPGQSDSEIVREVLAQVAALVDYSDLAKIFSASLDAGAGYHDWQAVQAKLFALTDVPRMIGVGTPDDGVEVPIANVTVSTNGVQSGYVGEPDE